jgi:hypothetical protein
MHLRLTLNAVTAALWIVVLGMLLVSCPVAKATEDVTGIQHHNAGRGQPPAKQLCLCRQHGPRGGCQRWTCRRQHQHNPWPLH